MISHREAALARKLAETFHLSVLERRELRGGKLSASAFVAAVGDILAETGWFPRDWRPDQPFDGVILEADDHGFVVHERHEVGVGRFSDVTSAAADSLDDAVRTFVARTFGNDIDGVGLRWDR